MCVCVCVCMCVFGKFIFDKAEQCYFKTKSK